MEDAAFEETGGRFHFASSLNIANKIDHVLLHHHPESPDVHLVVVRLPADSELTHGKGHA
jgi:hypothetical protein